MTIIIILYSFVLRNLTRFSNTPYQRLLPEREVCMGESWPKSPVQTERSQVCISDRGQDSPIQTNLARLIRCLLYGQTRKQMNKNINNSICLPARAQAFSWLFSVTGLQLASHAGVFRGARFSFLPTNACSTENNIPFPLFYLRDKWPISSCAIKCWQAKRD